MEDILYIEIGKLIKKARTHKGLTQQELSDSVNLTRASIANLERGNQKISIYALYEIADALKVSPQSLLPEPEKLKEPKSNLYVDFEELKNHLSSDEYKWVNQLKKKTEIRERDDNENTEKD